MKHEVKILIDAKDFETALKIAQDMVDIKSCLPDQDHKDLAKLLKKNPGIVKTAKKLLG
jgi:hypothetical protein